MTRIDQRLRETDSPLQVLAAIGQSKGATEAGKKVLAELRHHVPTLKDVDVATLSSEQLRKKLAHDGPAEGVKTSLGVQQAILVSAETIRALQGFRESRLRSAQVSFTALISVACLSTAACVIAVVANFGGARTEFSTVPAVIAALLNASIGALLFLYRRSVRAADEEARFLQEIERIRQSAVIIAGIDDPKVRDLALQSFARDVRNNSLSTDDPVLKK
jgi:hypothetical protein